MTININKFISSSGYCSRRQADRLIKEGAVFINGRNAVAIDKINDIDIVKVNKRVISHAKPKNIYLAFNKPLGVISTTDINSKNNIMDYIQIPDRVFPVGRLDVKSEGLIILTNDGELAQKILKEKTVEKEYEVSVDKKIDEKFLEQLRRGVMMEGRKTLPAQAKLINDRQFSITIIEGRKRQIRRMCEMFHKNVTKLIRVRIGQIKLKDIPSEKYVVIPQEKIYNLLEI